MMRLHVIAEGQTEEKFVHDVLAPYLMTVNVLCDARCVLTSRNNRTGKQYRGGLINYKKAKNDIESWLKEDAKADCRFSTMFDLYALPPCFPKYRECQSEKNKYIKVLKLEQAFKDDIKDSRFIPYIQLHEFETLIFADPQKLDYEYLEHDRAIHNLITMVDSQPPESINEGVETAPSKRILKEIPEYDKVSAGVSVVKAIGLPLLREKCPHFNDWLTILENLAFVADDTKS